MKRSLTLKRDTLSDLTTDELATVRGGLPTFEGPICYVLNTSDVRCQPTIVERTCIGTR